MHFLIFKNKTIVGNFLTQFKEIAHYYYESYFFGDFLLSVKNEMKK